MPSLILVIAAFMILEQLQIAPEIVRIAFAATIGALALGLALAFGLGGRQVAARMLEDAYQKGREQRDQVKQDLETAKDRGQERADQAKEKVKSGEASRSPGGARGLPRARPRDLVGRPNHQRTAQEEEEMTQVTDAYEWKGRTLIDSDDQKIGEIDEIYLDTETGEPEWATVRTGLFGTKTSFVPINLASPRAGNVHVDVTKEQVKDGPKIDPEGELSTEEERELYTYYGREYAEANGPTPGARRSARTPPARPPTTR